MAARADASAAGVDPFRFAKTTTVNPDDDPQHLLWAALLTQIGGSGEGYEHMTCKTAAH